MKKLLLILLCLPMIGFGQLKSYFSNELSFSYPHSYKTKDLNLSHNDPTVKLISETKSHKEIIIIKKTPKAPDDISSSFVHKMNESMLQQEISIMNSYFSLSNEESFGEIFSTERKEIFGKDVIVSYGKHEISSVNYTQWTNPGPDLYIQWRVVYLINVNNKSFMMIFSTERIDGSDPDSWDVFMNKINDINVIVKTIK